MVRVNKQRRSNNVLLTFPSTALMHEARRPMKKKGVWDDHKKHFVLEVEVSNRWVDFLRSPLPRGRGLQGS